MKKILIISLVFLILLGAGMIAFFYFQTRSQEGILTLYGNVDVRQVDIAFRVAGQVRTLYFEEGDVVPKDALMAVLDRTPYTSQYQQSKSNLASIKANLENAEILLKRRQELIDSGSISQENLDDALSNRNQLFADLASAEAAVQVARDNVAYTEAYAPTEGIILTRIREPGTVVNPADPVYTLSITSPVWVRAYVSEPNLGKIYFGMEAKVYTDTKGAPVYTGKIGFISPIAEFTPKTVQTTELRTDLVYRLRIYIDNSDRLLKQGMPVTVKLNTNWIESE